MSGLTGRLSTRGNIDKPMYVSLATGDIEIGAVEIKNSTDDTRATVNAANALQVAAVGNLTLSDPKGFIGLVTVGGGAVGFSGNVTLDAGSKTQIIGNITLSDAKTFIGLVTVVQSSAARTITGNITLDAGSKTQISGNVTLTDSKAFIGLVTIGGIGTITLSDPKGFIGLVTVGGFVGNITLDAGSLVGLRGNVTLDAGSLVSLRGNVTLSDSKTYIGLVTVGGFVGNVTLDAGSKTQISGNITLSDSKTFIGLVTIGGSSLITLGDPKGFIGLVTTVPTYMSGYTSLATTISASGVATLVVPPAGLKVFVRNMHVSSLGRAEISAWRANIATATTMVIPWTALATTGGFVEFMGENGQQWGLADDGLTFALNGAGTVGVKVDVRFA